MKPETAVLIMNAGFSVLVGASVICGIVLWFEVWGIKL